MKRFELIFIKRHVVISFREFISRMRLFAIFVAFLYQRDFRELQKSELSISFVGYTFTLSASLILAHLAIFLFGSCVDRSRQMRAKDLLRQGSFLTVTISAALITQHVSFFVISSKSIKISSGSIKKCSFHNGRF